MKNEREAQNIVRSFVIHRLSLQDMKAEAKARNVPTWKISELKTDGYVSMIRKQFNSGRLY